MRGGREPAAALSGNHPALTHYSVELAMMYGKILAAAVDLVLHEKMRPLSGPIAAAFVRADVPFQPPPSREDLEAMLKAKEATVRSQAERMLKTIERDGKLATSYRMRSRFCNSGAT